MDFWELAVQRYIARDRGIFLSPQYLVGDRGVWTGEPDFLAIDFQARTIWFVEVTTHPRKALLDKLSNFVAEYKPRILDQLERHKVISVNDGGRWRVDVWVFTNGQDEQKLTSLREKFVAEGITLRLTSLSEAVFPSDDPYRR